MRDGQYRLLWTGVSDSKKMKKVEGGKTFRIGCHLVYTWLLPWCDDDGRMPGEPLKILANVVPNEDFSIKEVEEILIELNRVRLINWYEVDNERFIQILDWEKYQRIRKDRYNPSRYPSYQPINNQMTTDGCQDAYPISSLSLSPSPSLIPIIKSGGFKTFWGKYPNKKSKGQAEKVWKKISPTQELLEIMLIKIERAIKSKEWQKDGGQFIPHPATWLNAKGWEDEYTEQSPYKDFKIIGGKENGEKNREVPHMESSLKSLMSEPSDGDSK